MKIPKFLLGATVLFWGWQTGLWFFAIPTAIILEAAHGSSWRWDLAPIDMKRIANFCEGILLIFVLYFLIINRSIYFIYDLLKLLPVILSPLVIAQVYSGAKNIDLRILFFWSKPSQQSTEIQPILIDLNYPYFLLCMISASAANTRNIGFYLGVLIITIVLLWQVRSKRFTPLFWLTLMLLAGGMGFIGQMGLHQLHLVVENRIVEWLSNVSGEQVDSSQKQTNIGEIGQLKQSNEIIFRVNPEAQKMPPRLLREATYNKYESGLWLAKKPIFQPIKPTNNQGNTWQLAPSPPTYSLLNIAARLPGGNGLLRLPDGTFQINQLLVNQMEQNQYGTVKVTGKDDAITYQIQFNQNLSVNAPPTPEDLQVPPGEKAALDQIISQLKLSGKSTSQILQKVEWFFLQNFNYSLNLTGNNNDNYITPLSTFLLQTRSGHCEYFASATTLLLREIGIPARYAVGYSVHEFSSWENQYVVRKRHAHAWSLAYINGKWQVIDTTPSDWNTQEDQMVSKLAFMGDLWSLLTFKLKHLFGYKWHYVGGVLVGVIVFSIWQLQRGKKRPRLLKLPKLSQEISPKDVAVSRGEFYLIEQELNRLGMIRNPGESWKNWLARLQRENPQLLSLNELSVLLELYYRDRFDPQGISATERDQLKASIRSWIKD